MQFGAVFQQQCDELRSVLFYQTSKVEGCVSFIVKRSHIRAFCQQHPGNLHCQLGLICVGGGIACKVQCGSTIIVNSTKIRSFFQQQLDNLHLTVPASLHQSSLIRVVFGIHIRTDLQ